MNDNELKTALIQRTAGVSADRVKQKVRERILTEETGKDESRPYEGRQVRRRVSVALIAALDSPRSSTGRVFGSTGGTSIWMSMRSSKGPDMRLWYFTTSRTLQRHWRRGSPR